MVLPELGWKQIRQKRQEGGGRGLGELEPGPCRGVWASDCTRRWMEKQSLPLDSKHRAASQR